MAKHTVSGPKPNQGEKIAGYLFLPVYFFVLPWLIGLGAQLLGLELTLLQTNVIYFSLGLLLTWLIFRSYLTRSFRAISFWPLVQAVILGAVMHYFGTWLLNTLLGLLELSVPVYNDRTISALAGSSLPLTIVFTCICAPVVEETLVRGLIFGALRPRGRVLAYLLNALVFCIIHVWQYVPTQGAGNAALSALLYIPASAALAWTYEKADTIWASILLHALINTVTMGVL